MILMTFRISGSHCHRRSCLKPTLDPKRDLVGATPEKLARALFRHVEPLRPRSGSKAIGRDKVAAKKVPANKPRNGASHLDKRS